MTLEVVKMDNNQLQIPNFWADIDQVGAAVGAPAKSASSVESEESLTGIDAVERCFFNPLICSQGNYNDFSSIT
jgi:hypothetical protein